MWHLFHWQILLRCNVNISRLMCIFPPLPSDAHQHPCLFLTMRGSCNWFTPYVQLCRLWWFLSFFFCKLFHRDNTFLTFFLGSSHCTPKRYLCKIFSLSPSVKHMEFTEMWWKSRLWQATLHFSELIFLNFFFFCNFCNSVQLAASMATNNWNF